MSQKQSCKVMDKNFTKIVQLYEATVSNEFEPEVFRRLLDKDFDVHYRIPDSNYYAFEIDWLVGRTIFELVDTNVHMSQALIDHGADFTVTNKEGSTILLRQTSYHYKHYLYNLKTGYPTDTYANVILTAHVNFNNPTNPKDKNGLSHFHAACMYNQTETVKFFLENKVPINETVNSNSTFYPGFSALHFAVKSCAIETIDILLSSGADMFAKDALGMIPLYVLLVDRRETLISIRSLLRLAPDRRESAQSNWHDYYTRNEKVINLLLKRMMDCDPHWNYGTGLSYFHVLCFMGNTANIKPLLDNNKANLSQSVSPDSPICPGYTALHFAAHSNVETVELLVGKGADLNAKDANGSTPFDICLREFSIADVHRILLLQLNYSSIIFSDGKTKLCDFIQAMQDSTTFENFLKDNVTDPNMFIPFDSPVCAGYTPLHLAVICTEQPMSWNSKNPGHLIYLIEDLESKFRTYLSRIETYLRYNPDVTTRDSRGSTPLHWAFRLQQSKAVHLLLDRHETSSNYVDEHGLSHLHIACAANDETAVMKLLEGRANVNGIALLSYTWINVGRCEAMDKLYEDRVAKPFINKGLTPLHFAATALCPKIVEILISHDADVLAKDAKDLNPLERIFKEQIFVDAEKPKSDQFRWFNVFENEVIKVLVRAIADRLADTNPKQMLRCYSFVNGVMNSKLLREVLSQGDESAMKILLTVGITSLHIACFTQNLLQVNQSVDEIDVNARVNSESLLWPGCTPLHLFAKSSDRLEASPTNKAIVRKLLQYGADVEALNADGDSPIHLVYRNNWYFVGKLLQHLQDFSVNPMSKKGLNHLHIASCCNAAAIVEEMLKLGAVVDQPTNYFASNFGGYTALHLAAHYRQKNVIDVLLKYGADVNWRNSCGGNSLHAANHEDRLPCIDVLRTLIDGGADIHVENICGETPLETLIKSYNHTEEEIELFMSHGSRLNTVNPVSENGLIAIALNKIRELWIIEMIAKTSDVKVIDDNGRNAIHNAVTIKRPEWSAFDVWTIDEKYTPPGDYIAAIGSLIKLGLNINHQDCKGLTPLHVAAKMQNLTGIIGLLENGADINITDSDGQPAFAYSLELAKINEELMELDIRILKVISTHIYKLNLARVGISISNRVVDAKIREIISPLDMPKDEEYHNEIDRMRNEEIDSTSITLHEFFSDTGAVSNFPYFLPCNRIAISSFFVTRVDNLRELFPELTGVLLLQYRKALARGDMIDPAVTSLNHLAGFDVPIICSRIILRNLSNDELSNMISSTTIR